MQGTKADPGVIPRVVRVRVPPYHVFFMRFNKYVRMVDDVHETSPSPSIHGYTGCVVYGNL